jgi:hypothetical protein
LKLFQKTKAFVVAGFTGHLSDIFMLFSGHHSELII